MGLAIGCIGISRDEFCMLYQDEFEAVCKAWGDMRAADDQAAWERIRTLGAIVIQPHVKKRLTPKQLLPMPWDKTRVKKKAVPASTRGRLEEVAARLGDEINS